MKNLMFIVLTLLLAAPVLAAESREEKQARLDQVCEAARQEKLAPIREGFIEECVVNKEQPNREECERFYTDYGNRMGGRAALFYDLPECVTAFEYGQSSRRSS